MHRTTTTATLLVSVAVSALAGCVTVQRPPNPGPPPASSRPSSPRPDGSGEPRVVQAPAREALEMVGPSPRPSPPPAVPDRAARPAPAEPHRTAGAPPPKQTRPAPHVEVPPAVSDAFPKDTGVCALGRRYGGWKPDSPEATICRDTYGR
ncbi:hypothetical protein AB0N14_31510 [Streptomyces sp. NPDC051104]|uniref:hypothetical protein n=1 Tax=Streptomyces sp. NPDC051104 TaxID=3155044 RepID=UPI003429EAFA